MPDVSVGEPRVHSQSTEVLTGPRQEINFLSLLGDAVLTELRLPGLKGHLRALPTEIIPPAK